MLEATHFSDLKFRFTSLIPREERERTPVPLVFVYLKVTLYGHNFLMDILALSGFKKKKKNFSGGITFRDNISFSDKSSHLLDGI